MKVMILAAGRGERLRPLTDTIPKPMIKVDGKPLLGHLMTSLVKQGFKEFIVNHAHLGEQITNFLGDGRQWGVNIQFSEEEGLETGGGIHFALPLLGSEPFLVINGDIWTDFPFSQLAERPITKKAHLVLVNNPSHHQEGDFLLKNELVNETEGVKLTFSGISVLTPDLFSRCKPGKFPLAPILREAVSQNQVSGQSYQGKWADVGSIERLDALRKSV